MFCDERPAAALVRRRRCARPSSSPPPSGPTPGAAAQGHATTRRASPSTRRRCAGAPPGSRRSGSGAATRSASCWSTGPRFHLTDTRRDAPRRHLLLDLQHLLARADRVRASPTPATGSSSPSRRSSTRVLAARERVETLEHVVVVDGEAPEGTISIEELEALGDAGVRLRGGLARGRARGRALPDLHLGHDRAAEGRAAHPRQHARRLARLRRRSARSRRAGARISFLPSAHIADRWAQHYARWSTARCVHCCPDPREMVAYSIEVQADRLGRRAADLGEAEGGAGDGDGRRAGRRETRGAPSGRMEIGRRWVAAYMERRRSPDELQADGTRPTRRSSRRSAALLGLDEVESFAVGAAPTPPEVLEFFLAIGIEICETWGMSETSAMATINPPGPDPGRDRRPAAPGHRGEAGRGRRDDGARPAGDEGLPQQAGEDGRSADRGRLAA